MYHSIYYISFIFSLLAFAAQVHFYKKHTSVYYSALFIAIIVNIWGTLQLSYAKTIEGAIFATQTDYLGACFFPVFSFLCIADLTKIKIPRGVKPVFFSVAVVVFAGVCSVGTYPFYYKTVDIAQWNDLTYLIKEYGPLHNVYPVYVLITTLISIGMIIYSFTKRSQISYITSITLIFLMIITVATYFFERVFSSPIEFIPISLNIEQLGILFLLNRISVYDVSGISTTSLMSDVSKGFVVFKSKGRFVGTEGSAKTWFPELKDLYVDSSIPENLLQKSDFLASVKKWISEGGEKLAEPLIFEREGRIIMAETSKIKGRGKRCLYIIALRDDTEQQQLNRLIKDYNENLEKVVNKKTDKLKQIQSDIIFSMANIVENRDNNTGGHIKRTSDIVRIFVEELRKTGKYTELNPAFAERLIKAAPLHDFGKIAVPDQILNKPGKFTDEEYEIMKIHPEKGAVIVEQILKNSDDIRFMSIAENVAHYHHEKWNGKGYPKGLKATEIPFEARVMALADVFDALLSKRVYKDQFSYDKAFSIIEESCGEHFCPDLCKEFLKCRPQLEALYNSYAE